MNARIHTATKMSFCIDIVKAKPTKLGSAILIRITERKTDVSPSDVSRTLVNVTVDFECSLNLSQER